MFERLTGKKTTIERLVNAEWRIFGKSRREHACFVNGLDTAVLVSVDKYFGRKFLQAGTVLLKSCVDRPLLGYRAPPAFASSPRLKLPFEKVLNEPLKAASKLPLLASPQALDLLRKIFPVDIVVRARAKLGRLIFQPSVEITLVKRI